MIRLDRESIRQFGNTQAGYKRQILFEQLLAQASEQDASRWEWIYANLQFSDVDWSTPYTLIDGRPHEKDQAWVEALCMSEHDDTIGKAGVVLTLVRYLDDYTFNQPYWRSLMIRIEPEKTLR